MDYESGVRPGQKNGPDLVNSTRAGFSVFSDSPTTTLDLNAEPKLVYDELLPVSNSADLSPPNLASPRFGMVNSQDSGTASLSNV